ncbi:DUF1016 family protein [bacterium]|nr:DUF1016 family protein [bacterium]
MTNIKLNKEYVDWLNEVKSKIRTAQVKMALSANRELILFYWELGRDIYEKQLNAQWGSKLLERLSNDLKSEFNDMHGLSKTNLKYCSSFYQFYSTNQPRVKQHQSEEAQRIEDERKLSQRLVDQIPWGHNILIFTKAKDTREAQFYIQQTIENGWSRNVLAIQLKSDLFKRQGSAITNFKRTLPAPQSDLAQQTIKDPYSFDFLTMTKPYNERDVEQQLIEHISKFLLELGKGFAFVGKQYHLEFDETDYYIDLSFEANYNMSL